MDLQRPIINYPLYKISTWRAIYFKVNKWMIYFCIPNYLKNLKFNKNGINRFKSNHSRRRLGISFIMPKNSSNRMDKKLTIYKTLIISERTVWVWIRKDTQLNINIGLATRNILSAKKIVRGWTIFKKYSQTSMSIAMIMPWANN